MALYDDASFIFLASAAAGLETKDASKVYNVKPVETLSSTQIVQGGDFSDASQWTLDSDVTIADNKVTFAGSGTQDIFQASGITLGNKKVKVTFTAHDITAGSVNAIFYSSGGTSTVTPSISTNGNHSAVVTIDSSANNNVGLRGSTDFRGKISNFSVREVTAEGADFDISRDANLDATRVGPTGLIEKGRENLALHSNTFDNAVWGTQGSGTTLTSGSAGYDGTSDAWQLTVSGESGNVNQSLTTTGVKTVSVYAKSVSGSGIRLYGNESGGSNHVSVFFALTGDGSVLGTPENSITQTITKVGNDGWYRCSMTFDKTLTKFYFYVTTGGSSNSTDGTVLIQDAQAEVGLVATDVITTGAATATAGIKEDEPRFDYPPLGGSPSLLIEPERINRVKASEYFNHLHWGDLRLTEVADNDLISPEGVKNAVRIQANQVNGTHAVYTHLFGVTSGTKYTLSIFAKKTSNNNRIILTLTKSNGTDIGFDEPVFNLEDGTITGDSSNAEMIEHKDGWWRCIVTSSPTSSEDARLYTYICEPDGTKTYQPTDTSNEVYLYGAQWEANSAASSYIPTHGVAATRSPDTIAALTSIPSVNTSTYTFFAHVSQANTGGTGNRGPRMQNASNDSLMGYFINSSDQKQFFLDPDSAGGGSNRTFSTTDISPASSTQLAGDEVKYAFVINGTSVKCFVDGNTLFDGTASGVVTANRIIFATSDGTPDHIKSVIYFPSAISNLDAMVITDTNYGSYSEMLNSLSYTPHG